MAKKILALILPFLIFVSVVLPVSAATPINPCPKDASGNFNRLCNINTADFATFIQDVITFLFIIAVIIATFFLIYGGIKWISSGGDKAAVEGARNIILAAVIGLVLTFLTYLILNIVLEIFGLEAVGSYSIPTLNLTD